MPAVQMLLTGSPPPAPTAFEFEIDSGQTVMAGDVVKILPNGKIASGSGNRNGAGQEFGGYSHLEALSPNKFVVTDGATAKTRFYEIPRRKDNKATKVLVVAVCPSDEHGV